MDAQECRRLAKHYLAIAQQLGLSDEKAQMKALAAYWTEQAEKAEQQLQQQQQAQPKKHGEGD
jgi:lipase chaperone LimK